MSVRIIPPVQDSYKPSFYIPFSLHTLINFPRALRRLYIRAPHPVLRGMVEAASLVRFRDVFEHVEELAISKGGEFFIWMCPRARRLGILDEFASLYRDRTEDIYYMLEAASHLPELRALHAFVKWNEKEMGAVQYYLPRLEELHCISMNGPRRQDHIKQMVFGFPRLRVLGISHINNFITRLRSGEDVVDSRWVLKRREGCLRIWREARREVASAFLHSGHSSLECVEIQGDVGGWPGALAPPVFKYVRDEEEDAESESVVVVGRGYGRHPEHMDWSWHPATMTNYREEV